MSGSRRPGRERIDAAIEALLDPQLAPIVDMVVTADDDGYEARAVDGAVRFRREADGPAWRFTETRVEGRNPLGDTATDRFPTLAAERATPWPTRTQQSYPHAHDQIAQLFDHPAAPDVACLHTAAHNWEDHGGERGEHGSLGIVQVRAPFVLAGAGVAQLGTIPRSCRLVDVAPTVLALLGARPAPGGIGPTGAPRADALLARQDGDVLTELLDVGAAPPEHVVGFLWDGCNANVCYDLAARGEAPNLARLMEAGVTLGHGAMASFPSVTLANRTAILTGAHPGHHGVLHNAWYDRATGEQIITNSPDTWPWAMRSLLPGVETIHQAVHRSWPGARTVSINEMCDRGADYSTFAEMRAGRPLDRPPRADELPFATERFVRPHKDFGTSSRIDHSAMMQAVDAWSGDARPPRFCFVGFALTDAAFHQGGPYSDMAEASVRDTDARLGQVLAAVERAGVADRTAVFVVADHGMEDSNPAVTGDWSTALDACGVPYRDEGYGFVYLDP
ncbi:MAG TPA: alkaline phosphatase family protein [Acidimicrobiales bacterium]|nr:alkaline phosphatase family protein [Acidimicrobiales bacterium]